MDGKPWSPGLLDAWPATSSSTATTSRPDPHILTSRAYQMPAVARTGEVQARGYVFAGPEVRRLSAEQFADAIGSITGEWSVYQPRSAAGGGGRGTGPPPSDPPTVGVYGRDWRAASSDLTRALGRPIRDQIISARASAATTPQALELVNGEMLRTGSRAARAACSASCRRIGSASSTRPWPDVTPAPARSTSTAEAPKLWLIAQDFGSNAPERVEPLWASAELVDGDGKATPLSVVDANRSAGLRQRRWPWRRRPPADDGVRVRPPSRLVYDIAGSGFTRFRGSIALDNARSEIGSTLNPAVRFFVFDAEPNMDRLLPPAPQLPMPARPAAHDGRCSGRSRLHARARPRPVAGRAPHRGERDCAIRRARDKPSAEGLADLLWAVLMKPEFQLIY